MKSVRNALPTEPANGVACGIDWARDDHAIVDHHGREIVRSAAEHNAAGLRELLTMLTRAGVHEAAIERPDEPVVDTLRGRYGSAGNKDDRFDAFVLADTLRTDRARLRPLLPDSPATVTRFDCQDRADGLSIKRLTAWLTSIGYSGRTDPSMLYHRLTSTPRGTTRTNATTGAFVAALSSRFAQIGDCRARIPTPESLACLARVAPSTRQSGKTKHVGFRWAADKQLRDAVTDFAGDSRHANPWAANVYDRAIARGHDHPHAVRILARTRHYIIRHYWQDQITYDPTKHRALQTLLNQAQNQGSLTQGNSCAPLLSPGYAGTIVAGGIHARHSSVPATPAPSSLARLITAA